MIKKNCKKKTLRRSQFSKKRGGWGPARYDHDHRFKGNFFDGFPNSSNLFCAINKLTNYLKEEDVLHSVQLIAPPAVWMTPAVSSFVDKTHTPGSLCHSNTAEDGQGTSTSSSHLSGGHLPQEHKVGTLKDDA